MPACAGSSVRSRNSAKYVKHCTIWCATHAARGDIVQRIRALAKKSAPNRAPFELNALIEESVVLIQREIGNHLIAPDLRLAASGLLICGDRVQLQQVVINLMMNAIQAMSTVAGRPRRLLVRSARLDAGEVLVEIEDAGPGIAAEDLQRLFQPFFTTRTEGMGMGLSICRSIVESHGGRIWATSQPGEGATLYFVLPTSDGEARCGPTGVWRCCVGWYQSIG